MTDYGLRRRYPEETLVLDEQDDIVIPADVIGLLTNFQVEAIRFLCSQLETPQKRCFYNDGKHMGKRFTLLAFIRPLIERRKYRVLIVCDQDEAILSWIFKLHVFDGPKREFTVYSKPNAYPGLLRKGEQHLDKPIVFANCTNHEVDIQTLIAQCQFNIIILDIVALRSAIDLKLHLDIPKSSLLIVLNSDKCDPDTLNGLLRYPTKHWPSLRRTNEEHLREFPWLCQRRFKAKFDEFKGERTNQEIFSNKLTVSLTTDGNKKDHVSVLVEESEDHMSELLFETDEEATPVKIQQTDLRRSTQASHLLSSMYLRLSQSFAGTTMTPKDRRISATVVQDSPDLFASVLSVKSDDEDTDGDHSQNNVTVRNLVLPDVSKEDTTNPFDRSTPLTSSVKEIEIPSQSPVKFDPPLQISQEEVLCNKTDVFEITSNDMFASKIKVTTSQKHKPVQDTECQLKFDELDNEIFQKKSPIRQTTPKRKSGINPSNLTSSGEGRKSKWLTKRNSPKLTTPEKVLAKKRKSVVQFFGSGSGAFRSNLDFSSLDDDETQRWDAC